MHNPDPPAGAAGTPPAEGDDAAYEALVARYVDKAFERIASTIPEGDAPGVRAGLEAFFRTNPRATQLLDQLRTSQPVDRSGTTSRRDEAQLKAAIRKQG